MRLRYVISDSNKMWIRFHVKWCYIDFTRWASDEPPLPPFYPQYFGTFDDYLLVPASTENYAWDNYSVDGNMTGVAKERLPIGLYMTLEQVNNTGKSVLFIFLFFSRFQEDGVSIRFLRSSIRCAERYI